MEVSGECEEQEEAETDIADIVRVHAVSPGFCLGNFAEIKCKVVAVVYSICLPMWLH